MILVRKWMMLVPRSQESFQTIAVNSLGFAGALLVHNQQQMAFLKENRPLTILKTLLWQSNTKIEYCCHFSKSSKIVKLEKRFILSY